MGAGGFGEPLEEADEEDDLPLGGVGEGVPLGGCEGSERVLVEDGMGYLSIVALLPYLTCSGGEPEN